METVCLQCGDQGVENALVYCDRCLDFAVHLYCLPELPKNFDEFVLWFCEDCELLSVQPPLLKEPCSIPNTGDPVFSKVVQVNHSISKLSEKDVTCSVAEIEEHESLSCHSQPPCDTNTKLDLIEHAKLVSYSSLLDLKYKVRSEKGSTCPVTLTKKKRRRSGTSQRSGELHKLVSDTSLAKVKLRGKKKVVIHTVAEAEVQRQQSVPSRKHSERQKKLGLAEHAQLAGDCSAVKNRLNGCKKVVTPPALEAEELKCQSHPPQQPCEENPESTLLAGSSSTLNENGTIVLYNEEHEKDLKLREHRRLILEEGSNLGKEADSQRITSSNLSNAPEHNYHVRAQPVIDPIWRGSFSISNKDDGLLEGIMAHLSSLSCARVCEEASLLPPLLYLEMLPKNVFWPKSFQISDPCGNDIALFFFPGNKRCEIIFNCLVEDMVNQELFMRAVVNNAELLVFTSTELPLLYWKFKGQNYLWGAFRRKQDRLENHHLVVQNNNIKCGLNLDLENDVPVEEDTNLTKTLTWDEQSPLSPAGAGFRGVGACFNCGESGHGHVDCHRRSLCFGCGQPGHKQKDCPRLVAPPPSINSLPVGGFVRGVRPCRNCGGSGHRNARCPLRPCRNCGGSGHRNAKCPLRPCRNCGGSGHRNAKCPLRPCRNCSGSGHKRANCPFWSCGNCGGSGHKSSKCPSPLAQHPPTSLLELCHQCRQPGHYRKDCTQSQRQCPQTTTGSSQQQWFGQILPTISGPSPTTVVQPLASSSQSAQFEKGTLQPPMAGVVQQFQRPQGPREVCLPQVQPPMAGVVQQFQRPQGPPGVCWPQVQPPMAGVVQQFQRPQGPPGVCLPQVQPPKAGVVQQFQRPQGPPGVCLPQVQPPMAGVVQQFQRPQGPPGVCWPQVQPPMAGVVQQFQSPQGPPGVCLPLVLSGPPLSRQGPWVSSMSLPPRPVFQWT